MTAVVKAVVMSDIALEKSVPVVKTNGFEKAIVVVTVVLAVVLNPVVNFAEEYRPLLSLIRLEWFAVLAVPA